MTRDPFVPQNIGVTRTQSPSPTAGTRHPLTQMPSAAESRGEADAAACVRREGSTQETRDRSLEIFCTDFVLQSAKKQPLSQQLEVNIPHRYYALVKS